MFHCACSSLRAFALSLVFIHLLVALGCGPAAPVATPEAQKNEIEQLNEMRQKEMQGK